MAPRRLQNNAGVAGLHEPDPHRHRLCIYAASRRVIEGSEPRDGLLTAITPSPRRAQRAAPNDSRNGSQARALTVLRRVLRE
jgi:hypothetical protein